MPRFKNLPPAAYVVENGQFPEGPFRADTPPAVRAAAAFARRLIWFMGGAQESQRKFAAKAGVSQAVISRIANGQNLPDLATIANLEEALVEDLWMPVRDRFKIQ